MPYYIYILKSLKDGLLYIGQTGNLDKRLDAHNSGRVRSTKHRLPLELVYHEEFADRSQAIKRERELKGISSRDFKRMLREKIVGQSHPFGLVAGSNPVPRSR
jgi:putative endonuclease